MSRRTAVSLAAISDRKPGRGLDGDGLYRQAVDALATEALSDAAREAAADLVAGLADDAREIAGRMLQAGRRLLELQAVAGDGGYKRLRAAGLVPFSEPVASKLRAVAQAVVSGYIPESYLPRSLTAAYAAARLPASDAERLLRAGVLRPEATAREIVGAVEQPRHGPLGAAERERLERRLKVIQRAREALDTEEAEIRRRLDSG